ncbi:coiled-coil domain-containing protein 117 [Ornithorhynchus anatinus]|nr:coiled-coil domain-containing protein 117 [Ornithorhynchus anatinus]
MAALGRPFSGLPLGRSPDLSQPPAACAGLGLDLSRPSCPKAPPPAAPRPRVFLHNRKKHKREEEDDGLPATKRRLTECALGPVDPNLGDWVLHAHEQGVGQGVSQCIGALPTPSVLDVTCEEMDQTTGDQQCEVARRKLQEIEERLIDEDEEVEADRSVSNLPTLIMSDALKTGLKRELDEVLTKKIIESMNRPSMELVLWKPLPEILSDKPKRLSGVKNFPQETRKGRAKPGVAGANFHQRNELFSEARSAEIPLYNSLEPAGCTEEEMEL